MRALAAEVQAVGNQLQDALQHEGELSRARAKASFATDSSLVEEQLREAVQAMRQVGAGHGSAARLFLASKPSPQ